MFALSPKALRRRQRCRDSAKSYLQRQNEVGTGVVSDSAKSETALNQILEFYIIIEIKKFSPNLKLFGLIAVSDNADENTYTNIFAM